MNRGNGRLVIGACLSLLIGCGARTSMIEDELGGQNEGGGSSSGFAGARPAPQAGASSGGAATAGAPSTAGFGTGGAPTPAGGAPSAGAPAGGFGTGGVPAGGASFGGFAGFGAIGGDAGTGGISALCSALGDSSCAQCQCTTCAPAIESCFSDLGCALILLCAQQTGCTGLSCYSPGACQSVIDQWGGPGGKSIRRVFSLFTCAVSSQAACGCN